MLQFLSHEEIGTTRFDHFCLISYLETSTFYEKKNKSIIETILSSNFSPLQTASSRHENHKKTTGCKQTIKREMPSHVIMPSGCEGCRQNQVNSDPPSHARKSSRSKRNQSRIRTEPCQKKTFSQPPRQLDHHRLQRVEHHRHLGTLLGHLGHLAYRRACHHPHHQLRRTSS
jgi:hypothetical protein